MARVIVADYRDLVAEAIITVLSESSLVELCRRLPPAADRTVDFNRLTAIIDDQRIDTVIFAPVLTFRKFSVLDLDHAEALFQCCGRARIQRLILLASAMAYDCTHHNPGLISESRPLSASSGNRVAAAWIRLERIARARLGGAELTVLRLAPMPVRGSGDYFSGLFAGQIAFSFAGYDPSIQVLSLADLARSVRCAVEKSRGGIFNVGPNGVIPLRDAFRVAGVTRIPAPHGLQRLVRCVLGPTGLAHQMDQVEYIRYSFTVSNKKISDELGFFPAKSSAEALLE